MRALPQHELIQLTYECAIRQERWPDLLRAISRLVGGSTAFLSRRQGLDAAIVHHSDPMTRSTTTEYDRYWSRRDPCIEPVNRLQRGFVTSSRTVVPAMESTEFYNEYCRPARRADHLIINTFKAGSTRHQILVARNLGDRPFSPGDSGKVGFLVPHLLKASELSALWQAHVEQVALAEAALNQQSAAVLLLDGERRIVFCNRSGARLLDDARLLRSRSGRLTPGTASVARSLHGVIGSTLAEMRSLGAAAREVLLNASHGRRYLCRVTAELCADGAERVVLSLLATPDTSLGPETLVRVYGLTPTESAVILSLCRGSTAEEVAADRNVRPSTVRWHIRNALEKLGVDSLRAAAREIGAVEATTPPQN